MESQQSGCAPTRRMELPYIARMRQAVVCSRHCFDLVSHSYPAGYVAPQVLVGELVGARLIAHAGSLMTLAKYPASTVQILGAEKVRQFSVLLLLLLLLLLLCPSHIGGVASHCRRPCAGALPRAEDEARDAQVRAHLPRQPHRPGGAQEQGKLA